MRLWSIHPKYLDCRGLNALWREGLLARKVLMGGTKGYKNHPQLTRFRRTKNPVAAINAYLRFVFEESCKRGFCFDKSKLGKQFIRARIAVTKGQLEYEFSHLVKKLEKRDINKAKEMRSVKKIQAHPVFFIIKGNIEQWEKS